MSTIYATGFSPDTRQRDIVDEFRQHGYLTNFRMYKSVVGRVAEVTYSNRREADVAIEEMQGLRFDHGVIGITRRIIPEAYVEEAEPEREEEEPEEEEEDARHFYQPPIANRQALELQQVRVDDLEERGFEAAYHFRLSRSQDQDGPFWDYTDPRFGVSIMSGVVVFGMDGLPRAGTTVFVTGHQYQNVGFIDHESGDHRGIVEAEPWTNAEAALDALLGDRDYPELARYKDILLNAGIVENDDNLDGAFLLKLTLP
jgi:hypothetical protein